MGRRDRQAFRNSKSSRIICSPPFPYFAGAIRERGDTGCCREENSSTPSRVIKALTGNPFWPPRFEGGEKKPTPPPPLLFLRSFGSPKEDGECEASDLTFVEWWRWKRRGGRKNPRSHLFCPIFSSPFPPTPPTLPD